MAIKINNINVIDDSRQLSVTGVNTLGTVQISSGIVTATTGIVTYYGDGSNLQNISLSPTGVTTGYILSNPNSISEDITLNNPNYNYGMFGPVTIQSGVTVTVGAGNTFTVV